MKVYVSGTFTAQVRLRVMADRLRQMGHDVVGTWLYEAAKPATLNNDEWNAALATKDVAEVFAADCIILDLDGESTTGGRYVEWGIASYPGSLRRRYLVGAPHKAGLFLSLAHRRFDNWEDLLSYFGVTHATR
ncbi:MAG: hypothetical protein ACREIB_01400 [Pseudomonadota bacterium]